MITGMSGSIVQSCPDEHSHLAFHQEQRMWEAVGRNAPKVEDTWAHQADLKPALCFQPSGQNLKQNR